jgi:hypothetical protein
VRAGPAAALRAVARIPPNCNPVSLSKCRGLGKSLSAMGGEFPVIFGILDLTLGRSRVRRNGREESFDVSRWNAWRGRSRAVAAANASIDSFGRFG